MNHDHSAREPVPADLRHPVMLLALGFGSGLVPRAPGTAGTVVGLLILLVISLFPLPAQLVVVAAIGIAGVRICGVAARRLGQHDHPAIVWDEIAGITLALVTLPATAVSLVAGFVLFRCFDIAKPWPIGWLDRQLGGGMGIMLDDVLAGVLTALILHAGMYILAT